MEEKALPSNKKRQAYGAIGGYIYQVYQSLYTWITLNLDEILFLEGAEDIDIKSPDSFKTIQIKRKPLSITLRSKDVVNSINNFWILKQQYKESLKFYFLTTANRGYERGNPFNGIKGLDYWDECKKDRDLSLLKSFLLEGGYTEELLGFIRNSSDDEIRKELIQSFEWLTEENDTEPLIEKIKKELIEYGCLNGYAPNDSEKAFGGLLKEILKVICRKNLNDRKLDKADFMRSFEDLLNISIPIRDYKALVHNSVNELEKINKLELSSYSKKAVSIVKSQLIKPLITDKKRYIFRSKLILKSRDILEKSGFIQIYGSTGTGKTVLATQILERDIYNWYKIDFRGPDGNKIKELLWRLKEEHLDSCDLLLDNLNFGSESIFYKDALEDFMLLSKESNRKIIITSYNKIPQELIFKINFDNVNNLIQMPKFSEEEIRDMLVLYSCPKKEIDIWIKDIKLVTRSHPQLVHARISSLREKSWNKKKLIFDIGEITEIKDQKVQQLFSELPSTDALGFLLRLSILIGNFKKENALNLAYYPTIINNPGVIFNLLVGPYIEQISDRYYCISPLLENAYSGNFSKNEIKELNRIAGESYIEKNLIPFELSNIFLYGLNSDSKHIFNFAITAFNSIKPSEKKIIYPYIDWFSFIKIEKDEKLFEKDLLINFILRQIQFLLAAERDDAENAFKIANLWFNELKELLLKYNVENYEKNIKLIPGLFYFNVFRYTNLNIPIKNIILWLLDFLSYLEKNTNIFDDFRIKIDNQSIKFKKQIIEIALINRINFQTVEEFIDIVSSHNLGDQVLNEINIDNNFSEIIINNIWLEESKKENPNWKKVIDILDRLIGIAEKKKFLNLLVFAVKAIAVIEYEYLKNKEKSLEVISSGKKILGDHQELLNYQAMIAYLEKDYPTALKIWINILPKLTDNLSHAIAHRNAFISAIHCKRIDLSFDFIRKAINISQRNRDKTYELQCKAEYGYLLWEQKNYPEFLKICEQIIDSLPQLPDIKQNLRALGFYKFFANALLFFNYSLYEEMDKELQSKLVQPFYGMFSQLEFSEELKKLPIPPFNSLWLNLAEIEFKLDLGNIAFHKLLSVDKELPILYKPSVREIKIRRFLREGNLLNLVNDLVDYFSYMVFSRKNSKRNEFIGEPDSIIIKEVIENYGSMITKYLIFSLLCYFPNHSINDLPKKHWEIEGIKVGLDKFPEWNELMTVLNTITPENAGTIMKNKNSSSPLRILASLYLLVIDENNVSRADSIYASALITISIKEHFLFYQEVENNLVKILARRWKIIASRLFETYKDEKDKKVLDICIDDSIYGIRKAAKIVLVANEISIYKVDNLREELTRLAEE